MKSLTPALRDHYRQEVTTLATLWLITRSDGGGEIACTDHDQDITRAGVVYRANAGFTPTAVQTTSDLGVDNLDVEGLINNGLISHADVMHGALDRATVRVARVNYEDPEAGLEKVRLGWVGEVVLTNTGFRAEMRGLLQLLQQPIGGTLTPECQADFCDSRCKLLADDYTDTGAVEVVTSQRAFSCAALPAAVGEYIGGVLTWLTGANAGRKIEVKAHTEGGVIELHEDMPYDIAEADAFEILWGCDKTRDTCSNRGNVINFRGFPDIPGADFVASNVK